MKVDAAIWHETPGSFAETRKYRSLASAKRAFAHAADEAARFGDNSTLVGVVYRRDDHDCPLWQMRLGPRGGIIVEGHV